MKYETDYKLSEQELEEREWREFVQEMNEGYINYLKANNKEELLDFPLPVELNS